jgi:uncharacterized protein YodC (DUF2158 family)
MADCFAPGDIVSLRSGGPPLTVSAPTRTDGIIEVIWFDGATLCRDAFDPRELQKAAAAEKCVYEIHALQGGADIRSWCRNHGFDCPGLRVAGA